MEVVFPYCAGLDVHKKRVTACRLVSDSTGQVPEGVAALQTFGTMTHELLAGPIGKKGAPYAAFFRGVTNAWGVSPWIAADG
jgi:hypothetical protein